VFHFNNAVPDKNKKNCSDFFDTFSATLTTQLKKKNMEWLFDLPEHYKLVS
jgi:hypothetical protein